MTDETDKSVVAIVEGAEAAAALAAQGVVAEPLPEPLPPSDDTKLVGWDGLQEFILKTGDTPAFYDVAQQAECAMVWYFGDGDTEPDPTLWGVFNGADGDTRAAMLRYIFERKPSAETLFLKLRERGFYPFHTFDQLGPVHRACFELLVRQVQVVKEVLGVLETEADRRFPASVAAAPRRAVPIEDTILEQVPGRGERMDRRPVRVFGEATDLRQFDHILPSQDVEIRPSNSGKVDE